MAISKEQKIKRPIVRTLSIYSIIFLLLLTISVTVVFYYVSSSKYYNNFNERISNVIDYVENNVDADDLYNCIETKTASTKYNELQEFLNGIIDDFDLEYLYIVIPTENLMYNVISATSKAEFEAGATNMPLLETSDAYSASELARFMACMNRSDITYFEEASDWGEYYTGAKALKNSSGEAFALLCVDLSSKELHTELNNLLVLSAIVSLLGIGIFASFIFIWLRLEVVHPISQLEESARNFANLAHKEENLENIKYNSPKIDSHNEVESLSGAINLMAKDTIRRMGEIAKKENENDILQKEVENAKRINEITQAFTSLLNNMPVLTYSKDIETGKYIACNKLFCKYTSIDDPADVVGKSDYDLYNKVTAEKFIEADKKAAAMDEAYIFTEDVYDAKGNPTQFQTTKFKYVDSNGRKCLLGMSVDISELYSTKQAYEESRSETLTYSNIARALSLDYSYLYYVDLETDDFIEYHSDKSSTNLVAERRGNDFFAQSRKDALDIIYADDQQQFIDSFYKEKVLKQIEETGMFIISYRLVTSGTPVYMSMKASKMENDDRHLIIGVNNVDVQKKTQESYERLKEERITYSRITALAGNYICIYTIDPKTDHYVEYSATDHYEALGLAKSGDNFFRQSLIDSTDNIYFDDLDRFNSTFTKDNVLREIKQNGVFVLDYRLLINGIPSYVSLKAALVEEKDGPQLIVGISNIDAQVKREQEYAYKLSIETNKANVDALTGVKNKHAYVDIETELNKKIEEKEDTKFAIIVFDVNGLKYTNDKFGHQRGDKLIKDASGIICEIFKHSPVFRIGGDEFCVIAQDKDYDNIDNLLAEMTKTNLENIANDGVVVACGMAKYLGDRSVAAVFERADVNMYLNKNYLKERDRKR